MISEALEDFTKKMMEKQEEKLIEAWEEDYDYVHWYDPIFGHGGVEFDMTEAYIKSNRKKPPSAPEGYSYQQTFVLKDLTEDEVQQYYYEQ